MRFLLVLLITILGFCDAFAVDLSLGPGLSVKNALVYIVASIILLRMIISGMTRVELSGVEVPFLVLMAYAILTWVLIVMFIQYPRYDLVSSGIALKTTLIDNAIFFFVFFHAVRNREDAIFVTKALGGVLVFTSLVTVAAVFGGLDLGVPTMDTGEGYQGRVMGAFGNPNRTAAFIVVFLPALVASAYLSSGLRRAAWLLGAALALTVLVATTSRGALVGMIVGGGWALFLTRRYFATHRVLAAIIALAVIAIIATAAMVSFGYGDVLQERFIGQSRSVDIGVLSSGRTEIWAQAVGRMLTVPTTLITGFGWDAYESMAFRYAPHSYYLWLWFDLGLIGVGCFLLLMARAVSTARKALDNVDEESRTYLIAFIFGLLTVPVTAIFGNLTAIWIYIWAYIGVSLRMVYLNVAAEKAEPVFAYSWTKEQVNN